LTPPVVICFLFVPKNEAISPSTPTTPFPLQVLRRQGDAFNGLVRSPRSWKYSFQDPFATESFSIESRPTVLCSSFYLLFICTRLSIARSFFFSVLSWPLLSLLPVPALCRWPFFSLSQLFPLFFYLTSFLFTQVVFCFLWVRMVFSPSNLPFFPVCSRYSPFPSLSGGFPIFFPPRRTRLDAPFLPEVPHLASKKRFPRARLLAFPSLTLGQLPPPHPLPFSSQTLCRRICFPDSFFWWSFSLSY